MPTQIETNYGKFLVRETNPDIITKHMYWYLRAWIKTHGTLQGAKYVYNQEPVCGIISTIPDKFRRYEQKEEPTNDHRTKTMGNLDV